MKRSEAIQRVSEVYKDQIAAGTFTPDAIAKFVDASAALQGLKFEEEPAAVARCEPPNLPLPPGWHFLKKRDGDQKTLFKAFWWGTPNAKWSGMNMAGFASPEEVHANGYDYVAAAPEEMAPSPAADETAESKAPPSVKGWIVWGNTVLFDGREILVAPIDIPPTLAAAVQQLLNSVKFLPAQMPEIVRETRGEDHADNEGDRHVPKRRARKTRGKLQRRPRRR